MDRRAFFTVMAGAAGAVVLTSVASRVEAATLLPEGIKDEPTATGFFNKLSDLPADNAEEAQYYGYRRRRRYRCVLRRTYYGWRRVCRWW